MNNVLEILNEVFQDVFDDEDLSINSETSSSDIDGWDSLMHINLIVAIERQFNIKFATAEIASLNSDGKNIGSLIDLITGKLA